MRRQLEEKELEKHGQVANKVCEKSKAKEIRIMEKQQAILHKVELVKDEINKLTLSSASAASVMPISTSVSFNSLNLISIDQLDMSVDSQRLLRRRVSQHLSRKEVSQMKQLQGKFHKLQLSLDELSLKLNKIRRMSMQKVQVEDKGTVWLAYINS